MFHRFVVAVALLQLAIVSIVTDDPWLSMPEAVEHLRTSRKSLYRRVARRQIRFTKDGNQLRFRRSWLDDYLRQREQAPVELVREKVTTTVKTNTAARTISVTTGATYFRPAD